MFGLFENKIRIFLLSLQGKTYTIEKTLKVFLSDASFKYKDGTYLIDTNKCIRDKKNRPMLLYEVGIFNPMTISTKEDDKKYNSRILNTYLDNDDLKQLNSKRLQTFYLIIIGILLVGLIIVAMWGIWNMNEANTKIANLTMQLLNITKSMVNNNGGIIVP